MQHFTPNHEQDKVGIASDTLALFTRNNYNNDCLWNSAIAASLHTVTNSTEVNPLNQTGTI
jgi:hypothetical protein